MSLLTPEQIVQMIKNGHSPQADHVPVAYLVIQPDGIINMSFMLTHFDLDNPDFVCGLCDFGQGNPKLSKISLPVAEKADDAKNIVNLWVENNTEIQFTHPMSVYEQAARMLGHITTNPSALNMAAGQLALAKARAQLTFRDHHNPDGPAFLPCPN